MIELQAILFPLTFSTLFKFLSLFLSHSLSHKNTQTVRDWLSLVPPTAAVAGFGYMSYLAFCPEARKGTKTARVNTSIRLEDAKVADFVDIEDIAEKAAFCRCWKSKNVRWSPTLPCYPCSKKEQFVIVYFSSFYHNVQWPYCDGTHGAHNKECGDNLGPVVLKRNPEKK